VPLSLQPPPPGPPEIFFALAHSPKTTKKPNTENTSGSDAVTVNLTTVQITKLPLHAVSVKEDMSRSAVHKYISCVSPSLNVHT
jgi:hypothetical protein